MSRTLYGNGAIVYRYVFDHAFSFKGWGKFDFCEGHVCHGEEIPYVFHSADRSGFNFTPDEERLSDEMIGRWTNFAYTADPNIGPHSVGTTWPNYDTRSNVLKFSTPNSTVVKNYLKEKCDFWDALGYSA